MWILRGKGSKTALRLAKELNCYTKKNVLPKRTKHFIINYGSLFEGADLNNQCVFNKLKQLQILKNNGIPVPEFFLREEEIPRESFPILSRKKYHTQGKDIKYFQDKETLNKAIREGLNYDFFVRYINKKSEYRIHVNNFQSIFSSVKIPDTENPDSIIRCHRLGWKHVTYEGQYIEKINKLAEDACRILKFDFGAVDIIRKKDLFYVLEINAAPALENRKLKVYAEFFKKMESIKNANR